MRNEGYRGQKDRHHRGEEHRRKDPGTHHRGEVHRRKDHSPHHRGAKTFRRGRAIAFLEMMNLKRNTLKQQLESPELQSINPILVGELKAIELVINEFVQLFELYEFEALAENIETSQEEEDDKEYIEDEKGIDTNETN